MKKWFFVFAMCAGLATCAFAQDNNAEDDNYGYGYLVKTEQDKVVVEEYDPNKDDFVVSTYRVQDQARTKLQNLKPGTAFEFVLDPNSNRTLITDLAIDEGYDANGDADADQEDQGQGAQTADQN